MDKAITKLETSKFGTGKVIEPLGAKMNIDLTPAQAVTGFNVQLSSFENEAIDDMQRDIYWAIYLANPALKEVPPSGREEIRHLLEWVLSDQSFKASMLPFTNFKLPSATAAYAVTEELVEMDQVMSAMRDLAVADMMDDQADDMQEQAESIRSGDDPDEEQEEGQGDGEGEPQPSDEEQPSDGESETEEPQSGQGSSDPDELEERADEMRDKAQNKRQEAQDKIEEVTGDNLRSFELKGAIGQGQDMAEDVMSFMSSWGIEEGDPITLSPETLMKVMKMMTVDGLANLTTLIGRVRGIASKTLEGRAPVQVMVEQAGYTREILDIDPAERFKLTEFYPGQEQAIRDFLIKGMPGVAKTMQAKSEGSFIGIVDESSSMTWHIRSEGEDLIRKEVSKALALGLAQSAKKNGQQFRLAGFSSHGQFTDIVDGHTPIEKLMEWAIFEFNGGTNFDYAFEKIMEIADNLDDDERHQTDYLIITDGECSLSEEMMERIEDEKEEYGARLFLLLIGADSDVRDDIYRVADEIVEFDDLDTIAEKLSQLIWL